MNMHRVDLMSIRNACLKEANKESRKIFEQGKHCNPSRFKPRQHKAYELGVSVGRYGMANGIMDVVDGMLAEIEKEDGSSEDIHKPADERLG